MQRAVIDDHLKTQLGPQDDPSVVNQVKTNDSLRKIAVSLDQLVNRQQDLIRQFGEADPSDMPHIKQTFAEAEHHCRVLELAAATGRSMIAAVRADSQKADVVFKENRAKAKADREAVLKAEAEKAKAEAAAKPQSTAETLADTKEPAKPQKS